MEVRSVVKENFLKDFSEFFQDIDINKEYISGIEEINEEVVAEALGLCFGKCIWISDKDSKDIKSLKIRKGERIEIQDLIDLGYSRVERVWNEGEFSVLGDVLIVWPYSMKNVLRISVFDDKVEFIDVVKADSRKKIQQVNEKNIFSPNTNIVVGNEEEEEVVVFKKGSSLSKENSLYLNIVGISLLVNQLDYYKKRGFDIWYLTNNLERSREGFEKTLSFVSNIYEVNSSVEKSVNKGFVYMDKKLVVLTDLEVLGEVDLSKYQGINKNIDPSSLEILKKIIPGDYIVHEDHGIGKFVGLQKKVNGSYLEIHMQVRISCLSLCLRLIV